MSTQDDGENHSQRHRVDGPGWYRGEKKRKKEHLGFLHVHPLPRGAWL